jgi:hypothetical protein
LIVKWTCHKLWQQNIVNFADAAVRIYVVQHSLHAAGSAGNASGCTSVHVNLNLGLLAHELYLAFCQPGLGSSILCRPGVCGLVPGGNFAQVLLSSAF